MATEEPVIANEVADELAAPEEVKEEENPPAKSGKAKKETKAKKPAAPRKKSAPSAHPPYFEVIENSNFQFCELYLIIEFFIFVNVF